MTDTIEKVKKNSNEVEKFEEILDKIGRTVNVLGSLHSVDISEKAINSVKESMAEHIIRMSDSENFDQRIQKIHEKGEYEKSIILPQNKADAFLVVEKIKGEHDSLQDLYDARINFMMYGYDQDHPNYEHPAEES